MKSTVAGITMLLIILAIPVHAPEGCSIVLSVDINNEGEECSDTVSWEAQENCMGEFKQIICDNYEQMTIAYGTTTATCISKNAPDSPGTHCVRIEVCDKFYEKDKDGEPLSYVVEDEADEPTVGEDDIVGNFDILFVPMSEAEEHAWWCDQGCEPCSPGETCGSEACTPDKSYCCQSSLDDPFPVAQGFDYGACGGTTPSGGGYCSLCAGGCEDVGAGGLCGTETCTALKPHCCHGLLNLDFCVEDGYDCGCCGGLSEGESCIRELTGTLTNNGAEEATVQLSFLVQENCPEVPDEAGFDDITAFCLEYPEENGYSITLAPGESRIVSCSGPYWPSETLGKHCWRANWEW